MADGCPKIMVVDDDPSMLATLEGIIEDEGYEVSTAADGYRAIELATDSEHALIFMDIKMPGINGVEAYREIKKASPNTVVVIMTGFSAEELVAQALEEGAYVVMYKPFDMRQIIDIIQAVLKTIFVLVVDDRTADGETLKAILEDAGYDVSLAQDGPQAIAMAAGRHYGVILMDVRMPGMDGFAACEEIRNIDPQVKIIFITGYELDEPTKRALYQRAYTLVTKPVDPDEMLTLMRSITAKDAING